MLSPVNELKMSVTRLDLLQFIFDNESNPNSLDYETLIEVFLREYFPDATEKSIEQFIKGNVPNQLKFKWNHSNYDKRTLLSGNKRLEACDKAQDKSDHYLAMLISLASGPNLTFGQLLQNQLERWQEARADKFIEEKRLKLYSLLSGN